MRISIKFISIFTLPFSLATYASEHQDVFIGAKSGYQWASDEGYQHSKPDNYMLGIYAGLKFTPTLSWDLGYQYHGEMKSNTAAVDIKTWLIESAVRYDWHLRDNLSIYGRLGAAYWEVDKSQVAYKGVDANGLSPLGEIGVSYAFNRNLRMSAGYQYIDAIGDSSTGKYDSHGVMIGLTYVFGKEQPIVLESEVVEEVVIAEPVLQTYMFEEEVSSITFASDSNSLDSQSIQALSAVSNVLTNYTQSQAVVIGYTDATGSEGYNQSLSENRALSVAEQLIKLGVSSEQIEWYGEGESKPIADNKTEEGRTKNRRVEITIPDFEYQQ